MEKDGTARLTYLRRLRGPQRKHFRRVRERRWVYRYPFGEERAEGKREGSGREERNEDGKKRGWSVERERCTRHRKRRRILSASIASLIPTRSYLGFDHQSSIVCPLPRNYRWDSSTKMISTTEFIATHSLGSLRLSHLVNPLTRSLRGLGQPPLTYLVH